MLVNLPMVFSVPYLGQYLQRFGLHKVMDGLVEVLAERQLANKPGPFDRIDRSVEIGSRGQTPKRRGPLDPFDGLVEIGSKRQISQRR